MNTAYQSCLYSPESLPFYLITVVCLLFPLYTPIPCPSWSPPPHSWWWYLVLQWESKSHQEELSASRHQMDKPLNLRIFLFSFRVWWMARPSGFQRPLLAFVLRPRLSLQIEFNGHFSLSTQLSVEVLLTEVCFPFCLEHPLLPAFWLPVVGGSFSSSVLNFLDVLHVKILFLLRLV